MPVLNDADTLRLGTVEPDAVFCGPERVWPAGDFPTIASTSTETGASLGTANAMPAPAGVAVGDLLLAILGRVSLSPSTITASAGWTQKATAAPGSAVQCRLWARLADGSAADVLTLTGGTTAYSVTIVRITEHGVANVSTGLPTASAFGTTGAPNPPSVDAGAARDHLWVAAYSGLAAFAAPSAPPAGYVAAGGANSGATTLHASSAIASRRLASQVEDPGAFATQSYWLAVTIAVPPAVTP